MESTLDIILLLLVVALIDVFNEVSPYLGFVILILTLEYGIQKTYHMYLSIKEIKKKLRE